MISNPDLKQQGPDPGLCGTCVHSRQMKSDRASTFYFCELSREDPNFPKYPRLPVIACRGYLAKPGQNIIKDSR